MGKDWEGKFDNLLGLCEVVYLDRTEGVFSTDIKEKLKNLDVKYIKKNQDYLNNINTSFDRMR